MQLEGREPTEKARQRLMQALGVSLLAVSIASLLWQVRALDPWDKRVWDVEVRALAKPTPSTNRIRLIFLDQDSLDWGRKQGWEWPWPREVYAPVLDFCKRGGAKVVAFDVIFSEPSERMDQDTALGEAIRRTPSFIGTVFVGDQTGSATRWPAEIPASGIRLTLSNARLRPEAFSMSKALFPIPEVATNATLLATIFGNPDTDGTYRRLRPFSLFDGHVVPSLGLGVFLATSTNRTLSLQESGCRIASLSKPIYLDRDGLAILRYRGPSQTHQTINVSGVIESELLMREDKAPLINPEIFKDAYVFLGFTAPGLKDLRPSPMDSTYPGVEIHATFLDNLLAGDFMRDVPAWAALIAALLLSLGAAIAIRFGRHAWQNVLVFILVLPLPAGLGLTSYSMGYWLPVVFVFTASGLAMTGALVLNFAMEGRQKRFIKGAFRQYLSPVVIEELVQHPDRLKLGGELRELSIFFSDVRGFTGISERLNPVELTALLNDYLTAMTDIIYTHGGTVDKYEGDAIIAFWNAPLTHDDHAIRAVRTALECQDRLTELNPKFEQQIGTGLHQRIGINSGPVVVGNMGSRQRFNYTFLGDAGNLAARLEGINKQFGTSLLISEHTHRQLRDTFAAREIARVQVVGREKPVRVYEPMMHTTAQARREILDDFARALALYYEGKLDAALSGFSRIESQDAPAAAYVRRCRQLQAPHLGTDWTGIWSMSEK